LPLYDAYKFLYIRVKLYQYDAHVLTPNWITWFQNFICMFG
jgi:hypothetical protein